MKIAIIDADLITKKNHRFPNLACMKISSFYKSQGNDVQLKTDYNDLLNFDKIFISKVFTDTIIDSNIINMPNVTYGGTGFYYDKAPFLSPEIEHMFPDYDLYTDWLIRGNHNLCKAEFKYYKDYSIGFLTRGCFRKCGFCVNKNYDNVYINSPLEEFLDSGRKKICLLDDNFLACSNWKDLLIELQLSGKPFQFKQGLDERLLTKEKCQLLFNSKYDGEYIFAFDNISDKKIIIDKLNLIRNYTDKRLTFYVLCGFDRSNVWDLTFWKKDLFELFERIKILMEYKCIPYIMRYNRYLESPYKGVYITVAQWCNQPSMFKKKSLKEFIDIRSSSGKKASKEYMEKVLYDIPELKPYFKMRF